MTPLPPEGNLPGGRAVTWWFLASCIEFRIDPVEEPPPPETAVVVDRFEPAPGAPLDVLFVLDDTTSMSQEQPILASALASLIPALDQRRIAWQVGVVTMDTAGDAVGWLQGRPYVLTAAHPSPEAALDERLRPGNRGKPPEAGLYAAIEALRLAEGLGPNAGFRREEAGLHVVFITDSDDQSDAWLGPDPVGAFLAEAPAGITVSAIVGDVPDGCTSVRGSAQPGARYVALTEATGGIAESICAVGFGGLAQRISAASVDLPDRYPLSEPPVEGSVRVSVDGVRVTEGWTLEYAADGVWVVFSPPPAPGVRVDVTYLTVVA